MRRFLGLVILAILVVACEKEILELQDNESETSNGHVLSGEERAIQAFNNFINELNCTTNSNNGLISTRNSSLMTTITHINKTTASVYCGEAISQTRSSSANEDLPIYELTLANVDNTTGFAVVAEMSTFSDVVAYAPVGAISDTLYNEGLAMYFRDLAAIANRIAQEKQPATRSDVWQEGWDEIWNTISGTEEIVCFLTEDDYAGNPSRIIRYFEPIDYAVTNSAFVPVKWEQGSPYNNNVPLFFPGTNRRTKVGCYAVAVGQVMAFHKKPTAYDWSIITATPQINASNYSASSEVSRLLINIATAGKTTFRIDQYGKDYGTTSSLNVASGIQAMNYNIKETYLGSNNTFCEIINDEMLKNRPVLLAAMSDAGGHIWVVDGVFIAERWYYYDSYRYGMGYDTAVLNRKRMRRVLLHCNWGWGGHSDGWYYNGVTTYTDGNKLNFNSNRYLYTEIQPI